MSFILAKAPREMVNAGALRRLQDLTRLLPEAMSSYYLECRLSADCDQVDLMGCVRASDGGRQLLKSEMLRNSQFTDSPGWKPVAEFWSRWCEPGSLFYQLIPHVWLSFDLDHFASSEPAPCLLICMDSHYASRDARYPSNPIGASQFHDLTGTIIESLMGRRPSALLSATLRSCHSCLPAGGRVIHMSVMLTRTPQYCKLDISLPRSGLHQYLSDIAWSGSPAEIDALMSRYCVNDEQIWFQLVVQESVAPTLELELHFDDSDESQSKYRRLLDELVDAGLCTSDKRCALRQWPGRSRVVSPGEKWPSRWNRLTDVKIVQAQDRALSAKGYLGFMRDSSLF